MPKVISNGKISIVTHQFQDRKRPSLCVIEGNKLVVCGSFNSEENANLFMSKLAELFGFNGGADHEHEG